MSVLVSPTAIAGSSVPASPFAMRRALSRTGSGCHFGGPSSTGFFVCTVGEGCVIGTVLFSFRPFFTISFDLMRFRLVWFVLLILVKFDYFADSGNAHINLINDFVILITFIMNLLIVKTIIIFNEHCNYDVKLKSQFKHI